MSKIYVGDNLKFLRTKKGENQQQYSLQLGISYKTLSNWERENSFPSVEEIAEISKILSFSLDDLVLKNLSEEEILAKNVTMQASKPDFGTNWKEKYYEVLEKYNACLESKQQSA